MGKPAITYAPTPGAAPEGELDVLASVYMFVLDCGERRRAEGTKKGTRPGTPDDTKGESWDDFRTAEPEYTG